MAKDPAFLFYSQDFAVGTQFFTDEQVGIYMRLLMAQHQHGRLSEQQVKFICKSYDIEVMKKFTKDDTGKYYNVRLENEVLRRKSYSDSRSLNRKGKVKSIVPIPKKIRKSYVKHMETETVNETITINDKNKYPDLEEFLTYAKTLAPYKPELDFAIESKYQTWADNKWKDGHGKKITNWKNTLRNTIPYLKPTPNTNGRLNTTTGNNVEVSKQILTEFEERLKGNPVAQK